MAKNRAHHNNSKKIIEDFMNSDPVKAITLLIVSIDKFLNNEIGITVNQSPPQTSLLFMGIHAAALTISEVLFNERGERGYKKFLEKFIDGDSEDKRFSLIASEIHAWRNTLVHGWLSLRGHNIEYEYNSQKGYERRGDTLYINPKIYLELYLVAFRKNGRIWQHIEKMKKENLLRAQLIIKQKYMR